MGICITRICQDYIFNGKILHGIPNSFKGKPVIPDHVEEVHISDYLNISELVFGERHLGYGLNCFCMANS